MIDGGADSPPITTAPDGQIRGRLLAVVATTLVIALLKWSAPATAPVGFALFIVAVAWPFQRWLERRMPRSAAFPITVVLLLTLLVGFVGSLIWIGDVVAQRAPQYADRVAELSASLRAQLEGLGFSPSEGDGGASSLLSVQRMLTASVGAFTLITLALAFAILGLIDVPRVRRVVSRSFDSEHARGVMTAAEEIAHQFLRYVGARTLVSVINGVLAGLFCYFIGLDFAVVWGVMTFLLNYIPTLGSFIATIPPVLFALIQFQGMTMPIVVLAGLTVMQLVLGNYVDPLVQGHYLKLSPFVVLVSIVFWGWVWGVPGALLGVPITVLVVIVTHRSERTRWIGNLLGDVRKPGWNGN